MTGLYKSNQLSSKFIAINDRFVKVKPTVFKVYSNYVYLWQTLVYGSLIEKAFLQNSNFRGVYIIFYFLSMSQIYGMVSIGMNVYLLANTTSKPTQWKLCMLYFDVHTCLRVYNTGSSYESAPVW